jgi:transposase
MISKDLEGRILRLHANEKWPIGTIAKHLCVHHSVVRRVVGQTDPDGRTKLLRPSMIDPFLPFVREQLEKYPDLTASRLHRMCVERGYQGAADHFRSLVRTLRPRRLPEAFLRRATLPGEEAQVDWAHFGRMRIGRAERPLVAFVMVLSYSRRVHLSFHLSMDTGVFLAAHEAAFASFGGVPRVLLYDNLKSAVTERVGEHIRFNERMLAFSSHHGFEPRPVGVRRGNEKGRVERAIRYIRSSFFAGLEFSSLSDLNAQAHRWCDEVAGRRQHHEDQTLTVSEAGALEREHLLALAPDAFPAHTLLGVRIGKTPFARIDGNDYTVPHTMVCREVSALLTEREVVIVEGGDEIARHSRSWSRGERIENPEHLAALRAAKRRGQGSSATERVQAAAPSAHEFLVEMHRAGNNIGGIVGSLQKCIDQYGAPAVERALQLVLVSERVTIHHVRQQLERLSVEQGRHTHLVELMATIPGSCAVPVPALSAWDRMAAGGKGS